MTFSGLVYRVQSIVMTTEEGHNTDAEQERAMLTKTTDLRAMLPRSQYLLTQVPLAGDLVTHLKNVVRDSLLVESDIF